MDLTQPAVFIPMFVVLWCSICLLLSLLGGWMQLAEDYKGQCTDVCEKWRFQSASMRFGVGYSSCLTIGVHKSALCLSMLFLFRFGHPPLMIPWGELEKHGSDSWLSGQKLTTTKVPGVSIRLRKQTIERIEKAAGQKLRNVT